jgi:hypothetical protein
MTGDSDVVDFESVIRQAADGGDGLGENILFQN